MESLLTPSFLISFKCLREAEFDHYSEMEIEGDTSNLDKRI